MTSPMHGLKLNPWGALKRVWKSKSWVAKLVLVAVPLVCLCGFGAVVLADLLWNN